MLPSLYASIICNTRTLSCPKSSPSSSRASSPYTSVPGLNETFFKYSLLTHTLLTNSYTWLPPKPKILISIK